MKSIENNFDLIKTKYMFSKLLLNTVLAGTVDLLCVNRRDKLYTKVP